MKRQIRYYGDPVLRKRAEDVPEITDEIRELVREMIEIMEESNGIGLAATQIGELLRIFIITPYSQGPDGRYHSGPPKVYINPKLSDATEETVIDSEGCLSIPKIYAGVERPVGITVEAMDQDGNPFKEVLSGYVARQVMHENDHLNGVLFFDRLPPRARKELEDDLKRIKKKYHKNKK